MFWTVIDSIKEAVEAAGEWTWSLLTQIGALPTIIAFSSIALFVSFVVLNRVGVISSAGRSDRVKHSRKDD